MNSFILQLFGEYPVAFNPLLARIVGNAGAGLFLSQMLYWCGKGYKGDWVYKTIEEMKEETCLSRSEQDRAIKKWKQLGVLDKKLRGVPPMRHFRVNITALVKLLDATLHTDKSTNLKSQIEQNTITENTSVNTYRDRYLAPRKRVVRVDRF